MVDADDIKQINTRFGHLTGDFVLAEIAAILKDSELFAQTANFELL